MIAQSVNVGRAEDHYLPLYVLHMDEQIVADSIGGEVVAIPPGEVFEFRNRFLGRKFLEHMHKHGVVEVKVVRERGGFRFLIDEAVRAAEEALSRANKEYIDDYIFTQHNDRLAQSRPALPPSPRQARVIKRLGVNLEDQGIVPIGAKTKQDKFMEQLVTQNQLLISLLTTGKIDPAIAERLKAASEPVAEQEIVPVPEHVAVPDGISPGPVIPESRPGDEDIFHPQPIAADDPTELSLEVAARQLGTTVDQLNVADSVPGPAAPEPLGELLPAAKDVRSRRRK